MVDVTRVPSPEAENADAIYAVGDIHGRLDLLIEMEAAIAQDIEQRSVELRVHDVVRDAVYPEAVRHQIVPVHRVASHASSRACRTITPTAWRL